MKQITISGIDGYYIIGCNVFNKCGNAVKPALDRHGYLVVRLTQNKKRKHFFVHRLIAISHIPNPNNYGCVNHKNGIKTDNRIENLEWCTVKENIHHSWKMGLSKPSFGGAKLTEQQVVEIKRLVLVCSVKEIVKIYPIGRTSIYAIKNGSKWKRLKSETA